MPRTRPEIFRINPLVPLARGLVFAGLGCAPRTFFYKDSSRESKGDDGLLTGYSGAGDTPADEWQYVPQLGRFGLGFVGGKHEVTLASTLSLGTTYTLSVWWKLTNTTTYLLGSALTGYRYGFAVTSTQIWHSVHDTDQRYINVAYNGTVAGVWTHFGLVRIGTSVSVYLNGRQVGTTQTLQANAPAFYNRLAQNVGWLNGSITDLCIYSVALSAPRLIELSDPSNVMLSGMIRDPRPARNFVAEVAAGGEPPTDKSNGLMMVGVG
jgi:hypothetical protein